MARHSRRTVATLLFAALGLLATCVTFGSTRVAGAATGAPLGSLSDTLLNSAAVGYGTSRPHLCVIDVDGGLVCVGDNDYGQIGDGTTDARTTPYSHPAPLDSGVTQVVASNRTTCAVKSGVLYCWGGGFWNDDATFAKRTTPAKMKRDGGADLNQVIDVSFGSDWGCALREGTPRSVWCWGRNSGGVGLGGFNVDNYRRDAVEILTGGILSVSLSHSSGGSACALMTNGTVQCWGGSNEDSLGRGDPPIPGRINDVYKPAQVTGLTDVVAIEGGSNNHCAITSTNEVWCWGSNAFGQLANGTLVKSAIPVKATVLPQAAIDAGEKVVQIALDINRGYAVTDKQTLYEWGVNNSLYVAPKISEMGFGATTEDYYGPRVGQTVTALVDRQGFCRIRADFSISCVGLTITGGDLELVPPIPAPPLIEQVTVGGTTATITVEAGSPGSDPTSFVVTAEPDGATCTITLPETTCDITGLDPTKEYTFTAIAKNDSGESDPSDPSSAVRPGIVAVPVAPILDAGDGKVVVTPQPGDGGGTPTGYRVSGIIEPGGAKVTCEVIRPEESCELLVPNDSSITVTTIAYNDAGDSASSSNSSEAVAGPPAVPGAPTVEVGDARATVTVNPGASGGTVSYFTVTATPESGDPVTCEVVPPELSCVLDLENGVEYTFTTTATNNAETSDPSESVVELVDVVPSPPGEPTVSFDVDGATVSAEPSATGGTTGTIIITAVPPGPHTCSYSAPDTSCLITTLEPGVLYTFTAQAENLIGTSGPSEGAVWRFGPPAAPIIDGISIASDGSGGGAVTVTVLPDPDGGAVDEFTVHVGDKSCTITPPATSCTVTGLTPGETYDVTAEASNGLGDGPASYPEQVSLLPPAAPTMPMITEVTQGAATVTVLPGDGAPPTTITVTALTVDDEIVTCTITPPATSCELKPLSDNTPYTVTAVASNDFGDSDPSGETDLLLAPPSPPPSPTVVVEGRAARVTIVPPTEGGTPTKYTVSAVLRRGEAPVTCIVTPPETSCVLEPLRRGKVYTVTVTAENGLGASAEGAHTRFAVPSVRAVDLRMLPETGSNLTERLIEFGVFVLCLAAILHLTARRRSTSSVR